MAGHRARGDSRTWWGRSLWGAFWGAPGLSGIPGLCLGHPGKSSCQWSLFNTCHFLWDPRRVPGLGGGIALRRERQGSCSQQLFMVIRCGEVACLNVHQHPGNPARVVMWAGLSTGSSAPSTAGTQLSAGPARTRCWPGTDTVASGTPGQLSWEGLSMDASKKVDLKIIIIGALGVGKTSLLHQYVHKRFYEDYRTTLGASILTKVLAVDNTPLKVQIWDTGGQERFRSMVSTFYKGSDGCMLAFDVTDRESFEALDNWRNDFLDKVIPREQDFPMVVLGNKIDISDRQVSKEMASAWCKEKDIPYFEVSAKNNINVAEAFETLAKQALVMYKGIFESYLTDSIKLTPHDKPKKRCC